MSHSPFAKLTTAVVALLLWLVAACSSADDASVVTESLADSSVSTAEPVGEDDPPETDPGEDSEETTPHSDGDFEDLTDEVEELRKRVEELLDELEDDGEASDGNDDAEAARTTSTTTRALRASTTSTTTSQPPTTTTRSSLGARTHSSYETVGRGFRVRMGRANWSTGYVQAEIYKQILEMAGYSVSAPGDQELAPALAYHAMVDRDIDFWANSWYPGHNSWLASARPDGSRVAEHVTKFPEGPMPSSGLQGFLATKSVVADYGITSIQQINDTPELVRLFDADGDGKAEIYGCPVSWTCDDITESMIAFHGWDNITQIKAGYNVMIAEAIAKVAQGEPMIIYTWQPSGYVANLRPGDNVLWITTHPTDVLDDSNPLGLQGGEGWAQGAGFTRLGADQCTQPCQLGWEGADILVTANNDFLRENPFITALFRQVTLPVFDMSLAILEYDNGDRSEQSVVRLASGWIAANRRTVVSWLQAAYDVTY